MILMLMITVARASAMSSLADTNTTRFRVVIAKSLNCQLNSRPLNLTVSSSTQQKIATLTTQLCISKTEKYYFRF
jgi:hypothetical protein